MSWLALLVRAYPPDWRHRYGDELDQLVGDLRRGGRRSLPMAADLICGAAAAWLRERSTDMSERARSALITVLWNWVAFAAVAAWFGHDLGVYPTASIASQVAITNPAVPDAYHVLLAAGVVGVAATGVAALVFAVEAGRYARRAGRPGPFWLMALPVLIAAGWLGGTRLIPASDHTAGDLGFAVAWLLLGVAGLAGSTAAVVRVIRSTEFSDRTWRVGGLAAAAVAAAMLVATGATITWGVEVRSSIARGDASGWLIVTVIMAVTTARAVLALLSSRHTSADAPVAV